MTMVDEADPDSPDWVTFAVELEHSICAGTILVSVASADEDLDGMRVKCPHCPDTDAVGDGFRPRGFADLAVHPEELEPTDDLDDYPRAGVMGQAQARDYFHVVIKGTHPSDRAAQRGVKQSTVSGAVSRARHAIKDAVGADA